MDKSGIKDFFIKYVVREDCTCNLCKREVFDKENFCADCEKKIVRVKDNICVHCGRPTFLSDGYCLMCKKYTPCFSKARSVFSYEEPIRRLIIAYKSDNKKYLSRVFAKEMKPVFDKEFSHVDFLTYVPISKNKMKIRKYNQAKLIADELSVLVNVPSINTLEKVKETDDQKSLSLDERLENLSGAFKVVDRQAVKNKKILVIDDILTTGSTAHAVAKVLYNAGAAEVDLLTVASRRDELKGVDIV